MLAHSFFMGTVTLFFETAASATFLSRFDASWLPWVYVAAAAVSTMTGATYARAQRIVSFDRLMRGTLLFLFALVVALRLGFAVSGVAWVAFAGLVSYRIVSSLTDLEYWAVASRIYDVRQAKRLFGLIGSGEVVARIAGAFCVPLLVHVIGVENLLVVSGVALAMCIWLVGRVLREGPVDHGPASTTPRTLRSDLVEIVSSPYLLVVVGVAVLATFGKYFVDFAFLEQVGSIGKGEKELATILGLFSGVTQTLSLLTRVFVSRGLIGRFGIRTTVQILPFAQLVCSLVIVGAGLLHASPLVIVALVIANQGIYKTLKHPIDNASFKVLYQPLAPSQRLAAQIAVEIIFSPLVVGISGAVMLLFTVVFHYDPAKFAAMLVVVFGAWAIMARAAGTGYGQRLLVLLAGPTSGGSQPPRAPNETMEASARAELVAASAAGDRRRVLDILGLLYDPRAIRRIASHLEAKGSERAYALELLEITLEHRDRSLVTRVLFPE